MQLTSGQSDDKNGFNYIIQYMTQAADKATPSPVRTGWRDTGNT